MVDSIGAKFKDYAPVCLRIGLGAIFTIRGAQDLALLGRSPGLWESLAVAIEVLGGLFTLIGLFTRWAAAAIVALVIVWIVEGPRLEALTDRSDQGYFAYLVMGLALFGLGGGKLSVDMRFKARA